MNTHKRYCAAVQHQLCYQIMEHPRAAAAATEDCVKLRTNVSGERFVHQWAELQYLQQLKATNVVG